ncbi:MAG: DUF2833 domain-containing protein [Candidatus Omnitrophica bacterium]|nr:DUF2833 domain-containing protein [Candidatus Omnitrophota bacterium]
MQTVQERKYYYKSKLALVRDAEISDVFQLASNVREADIREIWKSHHMTPETALLGGFQESELCFTIERNEKAIAMLGICPQTLLGNSAIIWLLASPELEKIQRAFIKRSRYFIKGMLQRYPMLENWVDMQNVQSIKWLRWCGAKIEEPKPYGIEGKLFCYFYFRRTL